MFSNQPRRTAALAGAVAALLAWPLVSFGVEVGGRGTVAQDSDGPLAAVARLRQADGVAPATEAMQQAFVALAGGDIDAMFSTLRGMKGAGTAAQNWLRGAFDAAAERRARDGDFPLTRLQAFLADQEQAPRARQTAYEWVVRIDPTAKAPLLERMLDDRSLALRFRAIEAMIDRVEALPDEPMGEKLRLLDRAIDAARDEGQLKRLAAMAEGLGAEVDLAEVMGFIQRWHVIGPFDNTGLAHFDTAYPPEADQDLDARHVGKSGEVDWVQAAATGGDGDLEFGTVDFIDALGKEKEAVAYAFTTFTVDEAQPAEVRYQSKNATKVWLNGRLIAANEVYHSGGAIDQYRAEVDLRAGKNTLLVKALQNEQKMPWQREWAFRLRLVDSLGAPIEFAPATSGR